MRLLVLASADVVHARRWCEWFAGRGHELILATLERFKVRGLGFS